MPIGSEILLRGNVLINTVALTQEKLDKFHWKSLEHLPYSPDLSPRDYYILGPLEEELGDHHFDHDDGVETFVRNWLRSDQIHSLITEQKIFRFGGENVWIKEEITSKIKVYSKFDLLHQ